MSVSERRAEPRPHLRVEAFEGPLDLLLHLCRTNEMDLTALPVRTITDQYLAHLEAIEFRDLETAGAYLVMAATLIYLKSKLLVPPDPETRRRSSTRKRSRSRRAGGAAARVRAGQDARACGWPGARPSRR